MAKNKYQVIRNVIEKALRSGKSNFVIYPFGENGVLTKQILNIAFGVEESYIVDDILSGYNAKVKALDYFMDRDCSEYTVLVTSENPDTHDAIRSNLRRCFLNSSVIDIFPQVKIGGGGRKADTVSGKYSYGPLCDHWLVESVGAFCSFASGCDVTENHPVDYISTHPFMYAGSEVNSVFSITYEEYEGAAWYFPGVKPRGHAKNLSKIKIGNDVWLGRNVIITNGANIGNGVIAGAGTIITKDVPDYAVVVGVPARVIRYRYNPEQIQKLNVIAWWDWPDELIRERYSDFFSSINDFIDKYGKF